MKKILIKTQDSSYTFKSILFNECYHSTNGAYTESMHIFINYGLKNFVNKTINILEIGYGTGLNAILSFVENRKLKNKIFYHAIELYPISAEEFEELGYTTYINDKKLLEEFFADNWNKVVKPDSLFQIYKQQIDFMKFMPEKKYDLVYFDAFSPESQPEMWSYKNLEKISDNMTKNGLLVSYCSKGSFKNNLRNLGFVVKRLPGPKGKRHIIKAIKT